MPLKKRALAELQVVKRRNAELMALLTQPGANLAGQLVQVQNENAELRALLAPSNNLLLAAVAISQNPSERNRKAFQAAVDSWLARSGDKLVTEEVPTVSETPKAKRSVKKAKARR